MSGEPERSTGTRIATCAFALSLILLLYVLSYAPVVRMTATHLPAGSFTTARGHRITIGGMTLYQPRHWSFAPVRWLTVATPLREPLLMWADVWGVREILQSQRP